MAKHTRFASIPSTVVFCLRIGLKMVLSLCSDVLDHSGPTLDLRGCTRSNSGYHGIHRSCKTAEMKSLPLPFQIQCTTMSESAPQ